MDDQNLGTAVRQDIVRLVEGAVPVHGYREGAQDPRRLTDLEEGGFVAEAEGDGVALAHPQALQARRGLKGALTDGLRGGLAISAPELSHVVFSRSGDANTSPTRWKVPEELTEG